MSRKTLIAAVGTAFAAGMAAAPVASAAENPFALTGLSSGYQLAQAPGAKPAGKPMEGKCGEGKCGNAVKMKDGKCGEGKCGAAPKAKGDATKAEPGKTASEKQ